MKQALVRCAAGQITGAREGQEDSFGWLDEDSLNASGGEIALLVLADGMGGHAGGALASRLAVDAVLATYPDTSGMVTDRLRTALDVANDAIADELDDRPELSGMGCTLVAAAVTRDGLLEWVSVGDSPMWLCRAGQLRRLNADHSMAPVLAQLVKAGEMTVEEARTDQRRHGLRSALTGDDPELVDVSSQPVELRPGDFVVLATDGIDTLEPPDLADEISRASDRGLETTAEATIARVEALAGPNQDNTTLLLFSASPLPPDGPLRPWPGEATVRLHSAGGAEGSGRPRRRRLAAVAVALALIAAAAWMVARDNPFGLPENGADPPTDGPTADP